MAFTEFCCRSGGSNLNAGTRSGSSTEPGTAADFTYASGNWVAATGVFTVASGNPLTDGVAVGDFVSVYADGSTVTGFVGRVTARDATTITVSLTARSGTAPTDGTGNRTLKVGGAWKGPNGTEAFPFGFVESTMRNVAGDKPRANFKNDATYNITAAMVHSASGFVKFQGYTTSYGDLGKFKIDGGTSGASYQLLNLSGASLLLEDAELCNNGATGSATGLGVNNQGTIAQRVVVHDIRGNGFNVGASGGVIEVEAYACNQANQSGLAGLEISGATIVDRVFSHDNVGSNVDGITLTNGTSAALNRVVSESNGRRGIFFRATGARSLRLISSDLYNNGTDGIALQTDSNITLLAENCNFLKNGGYGINRPSGASALGGRIQNCGFGSGTQANASGTTNSIDAVEESGSVTYAADVTPWVDPANGDFRINLAAAKNAGRGAFTQTAASYAGTVGYPDIGAGQHQDSGGSTGMLYRTGGG